MSRPQWHALLQADEREASVWVMVDGWDREYATVRIIRRGDEVGYRVDALPTGDLVGYWRTLAASCQAAHQAWVARHELSAPAHQSKPGDPWRPS